MEVPYGKQMTRADHERVVRTTVAAIHQISSDQLVVADWISYGNKTVPELADLADQLPAGRKPWEQRRTKGPDDDSGISLIVILSAICGLKGAHNGL